MKKVLCIVGCFCLAAVLFASVTVIPCTADGGPDPWAISSHSQPPQFSGDGKSLAWQAKIGAVMDLPSWAQILLLVLVIVLVLGMAAFLILRHARLRFRRLSEEITGREHATRALREFEEQFRTVVERARDGVCIIQDRLIKLANRRLAEMLGRTVEEITNTSFVHYIHPDELPVIIDRYERRMRGEDVPSLYETKLLHSKGHTVYVELSIGIAT
ncbi:MAG: PAS domain S-box protein, partial [Dehalococcoidales bacterium]|nr:PAS domain S-box protein [Dehalococcoidales bacterium]